jgi:hypothetical protein
MTTPIPATLMAVNVRLGLVPASMGSVVLVGTPAGSTVHRAPVLPWKATQNPVESAAAAGPAASAATQVKASARERTTLAAARQAVRRRPSICQTKRTQCDSGLASDSTRGSCRARVRIASPACRHARAWRRMRCRRWR